MIQSHLQIVRESIRQQCRCHGLSGVCQFQTCWDEPLNLSAITDKIRLIYLSNSSQVEVKNLGSYEKPDLYLHKPQSYGTQRRFETDEPLEPPSDLHESGTSGYPGFDEQLNDYTRVNSHELIYFYDTPDYCNPVPSIGHIGTRGRRCVPISHTAANNSRDFGVQGLGVCEELCCDRGFRSELALIMVACDCRFKFCCRVDCGQCLHQRKLHFCL